MPSQSSYRAIRCAPLPCPLLAQPSLCGMSSCFAICSLSFSAEPPFFIALLPAPMPKVILVAEDDFFLGETICLGLQDQGVETYLVKDGDEAVSVLEQRQPDLLLLDLVMPRKDGYSVLQHIRERQYTFPVVILSNLSTDLNPEQ